MSGSNGRFAKSRYNEDGLRVGRDRSHSDRLSEKRLRSQLKTRSFDLDDDDDNDGYIPIETSWRED